MISRRKGRREKGPFIPAVTQKELPLLLNCTLCHKYPGGGRTFNSHLFFLRKKSQDSVFIFLGGKRKFFYKPDCGEQEFVLVALPRIREKKGESPQQHGCQVGIFNAFFGKMALFQNFFISKHAVKCQTMLFWHFLCTERNFYGIFSS